MDANACELLVHKSFKNLSQCSLCGLLSRDSFFAPEVQIFTAVHDWCQHNDEADIKEVVSYIRLPLMDLEQLLKVVRPTCILDADRLLDAIEEKTTAASLNYRGSLSMLKHTIKKLYFIFNCLNSSRIECSISKVGFENDSR